MTLFGCRPGHMRILAAIHFSDAARKTLNFPMKPALLKILTRKAGRIIFNGYPTGVEVCASMHHGGPYPSTTDPRYTSVGTAAIVRFARPVCYQDFPAEFLPPELQ